MKLFTEFIADIPLARDEKARLLCLKRYLNFEKEENIDVAIRLLLGYYPKKIIKSHELKLWAGELTEYPEWLIDRSQKEVGNFIKTLALLLNSNQLKKINVSIREWMMKISAIEKWPEAEIKKFIKNDLCQTAPSERELILKLLTGTFKTPVSRNELVMCLSQLLNLNPEIVSLRLDAYPNLSTITMADLNKEVVHEHLKIPCEFSEIIPMNFPSELSGDSNLWRAFGNRDGIEAQLIKHGNSIYIWTRDVELITNKFPEISEAGKHVDTDFVLYGKIVPKTNNMPLSGLTSRLDKLTITKKDLRITEAVFTIWDVLRKPSDRSQLTDELGKLPNMEFCANIPFSSWNDLTAIHQKCRHHGFSGIILQKVGQIAKHFFWKATSHAIKAILMYVEMENMGIPGLRSMTFGVFRNEEIVPIAKIASPSKLFISKELLEFIKEHTIEKFGPVRTVIPTWVYELHFDGVSFSSRRKSGMALTNATIHQKIGEEPHLADSLNMLKTLL